MNLFWRGIAASEKRKWEEAIDDVSSGALVACFAWSDILAYRWRVEKKIHSLKFFEIRLLLRRRNGASLKVG